MRIKELSIEEFTKFQQMHPLSNYYQTINYALLMAEQGYDYDLIGYVDNDDIIYAASLILIKPIGIKCFYGYAPRGFLLDYQNDYLVSEFTRDLKNYYYEKNVIFIKLNPPLILGELNKTTKEIEYNEFKDINYKLARLGYNKLKNNLYFESQLPRFNAILNLKTFNTKDIDKNTKNKIKKGLRKGLIFERYSKDYLPEFYNFIKDKSNLSEFYYKDFYTVFEKDNNIDLFLISVDYNSFLENSQYIYNIELERNNYLNEKLAHNSSNKVINNKMHSDKTLLSYKNDIMEASKGISDNKKVILAGALVVKHLNTVTIVASGYNKNYKRFAPNYFMHYNIIKYYQNDYRYLDMNGIVGDFTNDNKYAGLNRFKLGFNPVAYEYLGELDLVIEPKSYDILLKNGILAKEFNKNKK